MRGHVRRQDVVASYFSSFQSNASCCWTPSEAEGLHASAETLSHQGRSRIQTARSATVARKGKWASLNLRSHTLIYSEGPELFCGTKSIQH
ncbi:hypothetical protein CgunFtcFv8_017141 [Champsocephalus gunnari]|uniref:Uncharacterized protein n=1 Tax=Champsocephalus gunnari TaxID=52237 RepID=A0AAN8DML9_CHAGU|nr:hypothetical protein CgunFtcFv8_017141 [Champsocephalus gunnari]